MHLEERNIRYEFINIDEDQAAEQQVVEWGSGRRRIPVVQLGDGEAAQRLTVPSNQQLDQALRGQNAA